MPWWKPNNEELDRMSDNMFKDQNRCDQCGEKVGNFTSLVQHLKDKHPEGGDTKSR